LVQVFPPEFPEEGHPHRIWFQLLRPELLVRFDIPLSSDAFSGFARPDPQWRHNNNEVPVLTQCASMSDHANPLA
jgi:hypothetical protein